jgi:methylenetetrahydrofolate dehydrogenase (NADP+)/methenyltetrahydrofolate cyclohydrolase
MINGRNEKMAILFTAKEVNAGISKALHNDILFLKSLGVPPNLATVRIGENSADISYETGASKHCEKIGINVENIVLPADITQERLIAEINTLGQDDSTHGILLFQPLPSHMDEKAVKSAIAPEKDVDGATDANLAAFVAGRKNCFPYCAPAAIMAILDHYGVVLDGADVTIVGAGLLVGKPLSLLMADRFATVTVCNKYTKDIPFFTRKADIVVSATGVAGLITKEYVREGQIVIDTGTTNKNGKLYGDVNFEDVAPVVKALTPTPGGVSGVTTAILAKHVVQAAQRMAYAQGKTAIYDC